VTIEWKLAFHNGAGRHLVALGKPDFRLVQLGTLFCHNDYNNNNKPIKPFHQDYQARDSVNLAPAGFDSSLGHVYRIVIRKGGGTW